MTRALSWLQPVDKLRVLRRSVCGNVHNLCTSVFTQAGRRQNFLTHASNFLHVGIKFNTTSNGEQHKNGPVCSWPRVKMLTPRHLCENPIWHFDDVNILRSSLEFCTPHVPMNVDHCMIFSLHTAVACCPHSLGHPTALVRVWF